MYKKLLVAVLLLITVLSVTACGKDTTATTMHLKRTEGTVTVSDDTEKDVPLLEDLGLYSGYEVDTQSESYAWINLDDVKLTKMDQESEIAIQKEGKALEIEVISGSLFFNVTEALEDDETMDIRTSTMLVGIRGTCGWVEDRDGLSRVYILEGTVECSAENQTVQVNAGEMAELMADGSLVVRKFTVQDIPAFAQNELSQDPDLYSDIYKASGLGQGETEEGGQSGDEGISEENTGNVFLSSEVPHNYTAYFTSSFTDNGDYYEVTGKIVDIAMIPADIVESMGPGDGYEYDGITFIYEQKGSFEYNDHVYYTFTDGSGNQYVVTTLSSMTDNGVTTYYYVQDVRDYDAEGVPYSAGGMFYILIDDDYVFHISKQQYVGICTDVEEANGGFHKNYESFKIEEIAENDIRDFYGNLFTQVTGLPVSISVDAEGRVASFSLEQELPGNYLDTTGTIRELSEINQ